MPSPTDIREWREYLMASPEARDVFEKISKIVAAKINDYVRMRPGPDTLVRGDEKWLINTCEEAGSTVIAQGLANIDRQVLKDIATQVMLDNHPLGPLMPLLDDPDVQNIHVNGPRDCYYFMNGERFYAALSFKSADDVIARLVEFFNSQTKSAPINQSHPLGTVILPTGERCHVVIELGAPNPLLTIRKHQPDRFATFQALAEVGAMPLYFVKFLEAVIMSKMNVLFSGGVNTGKTTWLRAFGATIPDDERLGVIEDDPELFLLDLRPNTDTFQLTARPPNTEGQGAIMMDTLIREALRMNSNRLIVGEVRGKEAHSMLKAMSSGWPGSACTIHTEEAEDAIAQLITYVFEHPDAPRNEEQVAQRIGKAIHLIVFLRAIKVGRGKFLRVLDKVVAVHGYVAGELQMTPILEYDPLQEDWFWLAGHVSDIGNASWQRRFRNAGIDPDDLIPNEVIERGNRYFRDQQSQGYQ